MFYFHSASLILKRSEGKNKRNEFCYRTKYDSFLMLIYFTVLDFGPGTFES